MILPKWLSLKPVVPQDWNAVDPAWMMRALRRDHPDAVVSQVRLLTRDDGTNRRARFAIAYAQGTGPAQIFVKAHAPAHRWVHLRNGNLFGESRLFASGVAIPCEHPKVYHAVPDYPRLDFLLVMEDLTLRGADPRDALSPLTADQVASGLEGLAKVHKHYLGMTAHSHRGLHWVKPWSPSQGWQVGLRARIPKGLERQQGVLPKRIAALSPDQVVDNWVKYVHTLADAPLTLLHGDAHIGNTYVLPDGTCGFLDWQVVRRGHWSQDVGYFAVGALTVEDRRQHERALLAVYARALGVDGDEVWRRYRMSPAYGLAIWLSTLGTDGWQRHEVSRALVERYAAAMEDFGKI